MYLLLYGCQKIRWVRWRGPIHRCMPTHPVHPKFSIWIHLASDCVGNFCSRRVPFCTLPRAEIDCRLVRHPNLLQIRIGLSILKFSDLFQAIINLSTFKIQRDFVLQQGKVEDCEGSVLFWYMTRASAGFNHATGQKTLNRLIKR